MFSEGWRCTIPRVLKRHVCVFCFKFFNFVTKKNSFRIVRFKTKKKFPSWIEKNIFLVFLFKVKNEFFQFSVLARKTIFSVFSFETKNEFVKFSVLEWKTIFLQVFVFDENEFFFRFSQVDTWTGKRLFWKIKSCPSLDFKEYINL